MIFKEIESVTEEEVKEAQQPCSICASSDGFMLKCLKKQCKEQAHPICLMDDMSTRKVKDITEDDQASSQADS